MGQLEQAKAKLEKAMAAEKPNKQQINQLKAKILRMEKAGDPPPRGNSNSMESAPAPTEGRRDLSPRASLQGVPAPVDVRLEMRLANGAVFTEPHFAASLLPAKVALYQFFPFCKANLSSIAAPANAIVNSWSTLYTDYFYQLFWQMRRDKIPVPNNLDTVAFTDHTLYIQDLYPAYAAATGILQVLNSPAYNTALGAIKIAFAPYEYRVINILTMLNSLGMQPLARSIIDITTGVFAPDPDGPVILVLPQVGTYAAGTMPDFTTDAAVQTYLTNIEANITAIQASAVLSAISGAMFAAYGGLPIGSRGPNLDWRAYDMWLTKSITVVTAGNAFTAPDLALDTAQRVPILIRRATWKNDDLTALLYGSLLRSTLLGTNNSVAVATAETLGLWNDIPSASNGTVIGWYPANSTTQTVATGVQAITTGVTLTDPISWSIKWAAIAAFNTTSYANLRNAFTDFEIEDGKLDPVADATSQILNQMFGTGYKGGSFTPTRPR